METLQSTALSLRSAGIENIKAYCERTGESFEEIKKDILLRADDGDLIPINYYMRFYNITTELESL
jgi:hypothetical protein